MRLLLLIIGIALFYWVCHNILFEKKDPVRLTALYWGYTLGAVSIITLMGGA